MAFKIWFELDLEGTDLLFLFMEIHRARYIGVVESTLQADKTKSVFS